MSGPRLELELRWGGEFAPGTQWRVGAKDDDVAAVLRALPALRPDGCPVQLRDSDRPHLYLPSGTPSGFAGQVAGAVLSAAIGDKVEARLLAALVRHAWDVWGFEPCGAKRPGGPTRCDLPKGHPGLEHAGRDDEVWCGEGGEGDG